MPSFHKTFAIAALSAVGLGAAVFAEVSPDTVSKPELVAPIEKPAPGEGPETFKPARLMSYDSNATHSEGGVPAPQPIQRMERVVPITRTVTEYVAQEMSLEEVKAVQGYQQAVAALKGAKTDEDREKARVKLIVEVEKLFQRDLDQREKQVAEAESRVKKLRDQLEKRKAARKQIVDLRVQTLFNDASGLGFSLPFEPVQGAIDAPVYGGGGGSGNYRAPQADPTNSKPISPSRDRSPIEGKPTFKDATPETDDKPALGPDAESEDRNSTNSNSNNVPNPQATF